MTKLRMTVRLLLAATALFATSAIAGPVALTVPAPDQPRLRVGDTYVFQRSGIRRVAEVQGDHIVWADPDDEVARTTRDFFAPPLTETVPRGVVRRTIDGDPSALWPLEVGASVEFVTSGETLRFDRDGSGEGVLYWTCEVVHFHQARTPAGDFDAFRVVCKGRNAPDRGLVVEVLYDYAPTLRHYVLRDWRNLRSGERFVDRLEAALPAELATPQRLRAVVRRIARRN